MVGNGVVKPDPEKINAVLNFPSPVQVRAFLGLTGYYRRFISIYATTAIPLTDLTKKSLPDHVQAVHSSDRCVGQGSWSGTELSRR